LKIVANEESLRKKWRVFKILKEGGRGKLNLDVDALAFQESIDQFLSQSFECVSFTCLIRMLTLIFIWHLVSSHNS
jgi:hypothetical protein